jgi:hypothetical protein
MADHVTKQTIDALAAIILAGSTDAGANVFKGRVTPVPENELPAVLVQGGDEEILVSTIHTPAILERAASIDLVVLVQHSDNYDAQAYSLLKQLEHLVANNPTASSTAKFISPVSVSWDRDSESEQPSVRATLRLQADLTVMNNAVDVPI